MSDFLYNQHLARMAIGEANMRQQAQDLAAERFARLSQPVPGYPSPEILARSIPRDFDPLYPDPRINYDGAVCFAYRLSEKYLKPLGEEEEYLKEYAKKNVDLYFSGEISARGLEKILKNLKREYFDFLIRLYSFNTPAKS